MERGAELLHPGTRGLCLLLNPAECGYFLRPQSQADDALSAGSVQAGPLPQLPKKLQARADPPWTLHGHFFRTGARLRTSQDFRQCSINLEKVAYAHVLPSRD